MTSIVEIINLKNVYLLEEVSVAARRKLDERRTRYGIAYFLSPAMEENHVLLEEI